MVNLVNPIMFPQRKQLEHHAVLIFWTHCPSLRGIECLLCFSLGKSRRFELSDVRSGKKKYDWKDIKTDWIVSMLLRGWVYVAVPAELFRRKYNGNNTLHRRS